MTPNELEQEAKKVAERLQKPIAPTPLGDTFAEFGLDIELIAYACLRHVVRTRDDVVYNLNLRGGGGPWSILKMTPEMALTVTRLQMLDDQARRLSEPEFTKVLDEEHERARWLMSKGCHHGVYVRRTLEALQIVVCGNCGATVKSACRDCDEGRPHLREHCRKRRGVTFNQQKTVSPDETVTAPSDAPWVCPRCHRHTALCTCLNEAIT